MTKAANIILRLGVALAFLYPPFDALQNPDSWIGYFPSFLLGKIPDPILLHGFGIIETVIAIWILSGWKIFWPSLAAAAMLVGIVVFNMPQFEIVFRDLSIAAAALALAVDSYAKQEYKES